MRACSGSKVKFTMWVANGAATVCNGGVVVQGHSECQLGYSAPGTGICPAYSVRLSSVKGMQRGWYRAATALSMCILEICRTQQVIVYRHWGMQHQLPQSVYVHYVLQACPGCGPCQTASSGSQLSRLLASLRGIQWAEPAQ